MRLTFSLSLSISISIIIITILVHKKRVLRDDQNKIKSEMSISKCFIKD